MDIANNTVPVEGQIYDCFVKTFYRGGNINVLFLGNSITWHLPKDAIGWKNDCGMAASGKENDYVHLVLDGLEKKYGKVNYCIAQLGKWEKKYWQNEILINYKEACDFSADIIISRLGENIWGSRDMLKVDSLYPRFDNMLKYFKTKPQTEIIVTDLFWKWDEIDLTIQKVAFDNGYKIVNIGDLGQRDECKALNLFEDPGVKIHPNDYGMKLIAEKILSKI